mmetsp:Transcript_41512/g.81883  ORF Transcript_41512/g.81883 Transcript_41512/m.81883 type:complete len:142 (+) Transcript_41512:187-612(+)
MCGVFENVLHLAFEADSLFCREGGRKKKGRAIVSFHSSFCKHATPHTQQHSKAIPSLHSSQITARASIDGDSMPPDSPGGGGSCVTGPATSAVVGISVQRVAAVLVLRGRKGKCGWGANTVKSSSECDWGHHWALCSSALL